MYEHMTYEAILQRMLDRVPNDVDKREGSVIYDALAPAAAELAQMYAELDININLFFGDTSSGEFLERRAADFGITRNPATKAKRKGIFYDGANALFDVPIGSRFSIGGLNFITISKIAVGQFELECETPGIVGNQQFGAMVPIEYIPGLARAELADVLVAGLDKETDKSLRERYLQRVRNPSSSGNRADYIRWASEVPGVGGVSVVPVKYGPGTVSVALIGLDKKPASRSLVDQVQDYIAPPHRLSAEAENMTIGGFGTSIDGTAVKMIYDAGGNGTIRHRLDSILPQLGIWRLKVIAKVDNTAGANNLLQIGVWNISAAGWATTTATGSTPAMVTLRGSDMSIEYVEYVVEFYWNGQDQVELRIDRLTTDTATIVWVDKVDFVSAFSRDDGDGKAPIGARVYVEPATAVTITVSATLTYAPGVNQASVRAAVEQAIRDYITSLAFAANNDVIYTHVGSTILSVQGVVDYSNLLVNGGTANIVIGDQEVAVLGTVTIT